jgi:ADP-ribose pyrophosphatase
MDTAGDSPEQLLDSRLVYAGRVVRLRVDSVRLPNGKTATREVIEHPGAVAIVAFDERDDVLLVRQYRRAAGRFLLEIPAGTLKPGEDPLDCAGRELTEETNYHAATLEPLVCFFSAPGFCSEYLHVFVATGLVPEVGVPDEDEDIEVVHLPLAECLARVRSGEICDAKSVAGLLAASCLRDHAGQA